MIGWRDLLEMWRRRFLRDFKSDLDRVGVASKGSDPVRGQTPIVVSVGRFVRGALCLIVPGLLRGPGRRLGSGLI